MIAARPRKTCLWPVGFALVVAIANGIPANAATGPAYPEDVIEADAREVALIPHYCKYTQIFRDRVPGGNNKAEIDRWYSLLGPTFHHLHHYCWGLMKTNRAVFLANNQQERQMYLRSSLGEFDYVLRQAPADFVLLPEILTKKGANLLQMDDVTNGMTTLLRAISLKSDYWPPYATLSDYFKKIKNMSAAREWLEKGLEASPNSKALQQRLAELGSAKAK